MKIHREILMLGLGQAACAVGSLVGVRLLTGLMPPSAYGELALAMTAATVLNQIGFSPLASASLRFFAPARENNAEIPFLRVCRYLCDRITVAVLAGGLALTALFVAIGRVDDAELALGTTVFALLSGQNILMDALQNAVRRRHVFVFHQTLAAWGRFLLAAGFVWFVGASSAAAMLGYAASALLVFASQMRFAPHGISFRLSAPDKAAHVEAQRWRNQVLRFAWPAAAWGLFSWMQTASDRWALQVFHGSADVGLYAALYQIGYYPITIGSGLFIQLAEPIFYERAGSGSDVARMAKVFRDANKITVLLIIATGIAVGILGVFHSMVFRIFVAQRYASVSWLLPGLVLAGGLFTAAQFNTIFLNCLLKTKALLAPKIVCASLAVILNVVLAKGHGTSGVVLANIIGSLVYLIWIIFLVQTSFRQIRKHGDSPRGETELRLIAEKPFSAVSKHANP